MANETFCALELQLVFITYLVIYHVIYYVSVVVRRQVIKNIWSVRFPKEKGKNSFMIYMTLDVYRIETFQNVMF